MSHQLLFSSRDFDLIPGDPCFHNPVNLGGRWYWLVDLTFGAWSVRISTRARAANDFTESDSAALAAILSHLTTIYGPDAVAALEARAASPVALPPIPGPLFDLNHFGPVWATYEQDAAKYAPDRDRPQSPKPELATPDVAARPAPAKPAPTRSTSYRTKPQAVPGSSLFGVSS